jgi:hypothetical protein
LHTVVEPHIAAVGIVLPFEEAWPLIAEKDGLAPAAAAAAGGKEERQENAYLAEMGLFSLVHDEYTFFWLKQEVVFR